MIDWLATQILASGVRSFVFLHNPTFCRWIDTLQLLTAVIAAGAAARLSWAAVAGRRAARARAAAVANDREARRASQALADARSALDSSRPRSARAPAPRVVACPLPWLGTVGLLRPRVWLTDAAVRLLDPGELRAALAHELVHVDRRDNLRRAAFEVACFLTPVALWWWYSLHLVVSTWLQFVTLLCLGLASGLLLRAVALPALTYWQERRADEWAARAVGDRLSVAGALVKVGRALHRQRPGALAAQHASFAPYGRRVAGRVRRLLDDDGRGFAALDLGLRRSLQAVAAALVVLLGLAAHRAETLSLDSQLQVSLCSSPLTVQLRSLPAPRSTEVSAVGSERVRFEVP